MWVEPSSEDSLEIDFVVKIMKIIALSGNLHLHFPLGNLHFALGKKKTQLRQLWKTLYKEISPTESY